MKNPQNIISELIDKGLTQQAIASEIPCSQSFVSDMVNGKCGLARPSWKVVAGLLALAKKHEVETEEPDAPQAQA